MAQKQEQTVQTKGCGCAMLKLYLQKQGHIVPTKTTQCHSYHLKVKTDNT